MDPTYTCGFIGLGSQGAPIAQRMIDGGYRTMLWARRPETLVPFQHAGALFASSVAELASQADHVGVCVVGDDGVIDICEQLIPTMKSASRLLIHSTVLPETCQAVARMAEKQGVIVVDAPVSGGAPAAESGQLTVMLGCAADTIESVRPVLETFASLIVHLGDVGAGQRAKLINNSLLVANMGLLHSAITAGVADGLDRDRLIQLLGASSGRSFALQVYANNPDPQSFGRLRTMIEKVDLLGEVLGKDHPTYKLMSTAVAPLA